MILPHESPCLYYLFLVLDSPVLHDLVLNSNNDVFPPTRLWTIYFLTMLIWKQDTFKVCFLNVNFIVFLYRLMKNKMHINENIFLLIFLINFFFGYYVLKYVFSSIIKHLFSSIKWEGEFRQEKSNRPKKYKEPPTLHPSVVR